MEKGNKDSPLTEHNQDCHPGQVPQFKMQVEGFYRRPLYRQTREGQLIADNEEGTLLNRRGEWGQNLPPKLEIVVEDKVVRDRVAKRKEGKSDPSLRDTKRQKRVSEEDMSTSPIQMSTSQCKHDILQMTHTYTDVCSHDSRNVTYKHTDRENMQVTFIDTYDHGHIDENIFSNVNNSHQASKAKQNLSSGHKSINEFLIPAKLNSELGTLRTFSGANLKF